MSRLTSRLLGVLVLAVGTAGAAQAEGLYLGANIAAPNYNSAINGSGGGGGGGSAGAGLYGGYTLGPNFAVEGGYSFLGSTHDINGVARGQSLYLDGVGSVMFAPQWSLQGRLGVAQGWFSSPGGNDHSPGLKAGVGLQYDLTQHYALRLGYDYYRFANAFDAKANVGQTTFGLKVTF